MIKYVIVGNGAAALSAAEEIRKNDGEGAITILTDEQTPFYYRPGLIEVLAGRKDIEDLIIRPQTWYETNRISVQYNSTVISVDPEARSLLTRDGETVPYDRLLLSNGGRSNVPPPYRTEADGVFSLRDVRDLERIVEYSDTVDSVIVVGGGLLGLECANAMMERGKVVTVVEYFSRLLPRQLDHEGSRVLLDMLEDKGLGFLLGAEGNGVLEEDGKAVGISLKNGDDVRGDMVIVSAGVRGRLDLAQSAGCETDKGVKVDEKMATTVPDIWAAGDSIEREGRLWGIWPASQQQGKIAGNRMSGGDLTYRGTVLSTTLKVASISLSSMGNIDADGVLDSVVARKDRLYRKIVLDDGILVGAIFLGTNAGQARVQRAIADEVDVSDKRELISDPDYDFGNL